MLEIAPVLGVLAGAIGVADTIPYVRDILRGKTRPHRGTWLIWATLTVVAVFSQHADGASWSLVLVASQAVAMTLIFALSVRRGVGGVSRGDLTLMTVAAAGVAGWLIADEPLVATACVVAADLIAAGMMVPKTWRDPGSETLVTYAFASLGGALATGAVGALDVSLLLYPAYYCLVNGAIALLIVHRRRVIAAWSHPATASGPSGPAAPRPAATRPTGGAW
jgi:hypothetical protein